LIETLEFLFHPEELKNICSDVMHWDNFFSAIIFTSPRAVDVFQMSGLPAKKNIICFVVGNATKVLAESLGFETAGAESGNADVLLDTIVNYDRAALNKPLLFPCGKIHRPVLPQKLEENGLQVKSVIVYSTKESTELSERLKQLFTNDQNPPDLLVFFSPSGISFSEKVLKEEIMKKHAHLKFGSMGPATSAQLTSFGFTVELESRFPKPEALLKAIKGIIAAG